MLAGCDAGANQAAAEEQPEGRAPVTEAISRFEPAAVDRARAAIMAEARVRDVLFDDSPLSATWQVGTVGVDGPAFGYAEYICLLLREQGVFDDRTSVRVVDLTSPAAREGDFRAASLGWVDCSSGERAAI